MSFTRELSLPLRSLFNTKRFLRDTPCLCIAVAAGRIQRRRLFCAPYLNNVLRPLLVVGIDGRVAAPRLIATHVHYVDPEAFQLSHRPVGGGVLTPVNSANPPVPEIAVAGRVRL